MISSRSAPYPLVRNLSDCSTRRGVWRKPSRSGSSPISASKRLRVSCITAFYLLAVVTTVAGAAAPSRAQAPDPDALYRQRENLASARQALNIWAARAAAGKDFEAIWKLARASYWIGTHGAETERRVALDRGVAAGEQAVALQPGKPEGYFWKAANMGALAESFGMWQGLKYRGRIKDALLRVLAIDPGWQQGSADRALGRWYFKVPGLFGGSTSKAEAHLRKALAYNPQSTVTLYFLAELLVDDGRVEAGRAMFQQVLTAPLDPEWTPEDRGFKYMAAEKLKTMKMPARQFVP